MYTEMKDKVAAVISYLGWPLWVVAFIIRNRQDALSRRHLNQALVLGIARLIVRFMTHFHGFTGFAGGILGAGILVMTILGIVRAARESSEPLPVIGDIQLL